jgi:CheY-like chemotaxis protein
MDIRLPGMNGLEATRIITSDPELKVIPVIAVTTSVMLGDEKKCIDAGCIGHISKPIEVKRFVHTMEQIVAEHQSTNGG